MEGCQGPYHTLEGYIKKPFYWVFSSGQRRGKESRVFPYRKNKTSSGRRHLLGGVWVDLCNREAVELELPVLRLTTLRIFFIRVTVLL